MKYATGWIAMALVAGLCLALAVSVAQAMDAASDAAAQAQAEATFERMFGEEYRRVLATSRRDDDVELAQRLHSLMEDTRTMSPAMVQLLVDRIERLTRHNNQAIDLSIAVYELAQQRVGGGEVDYRPRIVELRTRNLILARGPEAVVNAQALIRLQREQADELIAVRAYERAVPLLRQALQVAARINDPEVAAIRQTIEHATGMLRFTRMIEGLERRVQANAADHASRQRIVEIYTIEFDSPEEALAHVNPRLEQDQHRLLTLAGRDPQSLSAANALELAQWYRQHADQASPTGKARMLERSRGYLDHFLAQHHTEDLQRAKARMDREEVEKLLVEATGGAGVGRGLVAGTDLLTLIQVERDTIHGRWNLRQGVLESGRANATRITVPIIPEGNYTLALDLVRVTGDDAAIIGLPVGDQHVTLIIDGERGTITGLGDISRRRFHQGTANIKGGLITNGRRHSVQARVHSDGTQARIEVIFDNRPVLTWEGRVSDLSPDRGVLPRHPEAVMLSAWNSVFHYSNLRIDMRSGRLRPLTP